MSTTSVSVFHQKFKWTVSYPNPSLPDENYSFEGSKLIFPNTVIRGGGIRGWRKLIASGENATTSLSGVRWYLSPSVSNLDHSVTHRTFPEHVTNARIVLSGQLLVPEFPSGTSMPTLGLAITSADNQALTRYYSNLNAVTTHFKGAVFSGELRESLTMIRHPARALRNGMSSYLSALKRGGRRLPKSKRESFVRKTWLEYSFGWKPLINDIDGAISAFYKSRSARPIFEMVKGTGRDEAVSDTPGAVQIDVGAGHQLVHDHHREEEVFVKYFGIQRSDGRGVADSHSYGFKPEEFVPTVWELIPYSFLVDYFTNIGGILSSWSYRFVRNGWTAKTVRTSYRYNSANATIIPVFTTYPQATYMHETGGSPGSAFYEAVSVQRIPNVVPGLPTLELRVPGRWDQWVNIVALTAGLNSTRRALAR